MIASPSRWIPALVVLGLGLVVNRCGAAASAGQPAHQDLSVPVHDTRLHDSFQSGLTGLLESGKNTKTEVLLGQLQRDHCSLALPNRPAQKMTLAQLYENSKKSVLVVGRLYKCPQCGRQHASVASGFVLTAGGVAATNYHVMDHPEALALGAMTADGRVYAVKEVLAADKEGDVAILQLDGAGFTPLALSSEAPVGAAVAVIGHPGNSFYSLTPGVISRHFVVDREGREVEWIAATAEIGVGSSGAPLFNESGVVVGMAAQTRLVQKTDTENHQSMPQMTINLFTPARAILRLIRPSGAGS